MDLLRSIPLQKIFQGGVGTTLLLRQKAEATLRGHGSGVSARISLFSIPPIRRVEGILKKRPVHYRSGIPDDFKNLLESKRQSVF